MSNSLVYNFSKLQSEIENLLLKRGVSEVVAFDVSSGLVWASLRGIDSHGIRLLPHYLSGVAGGRINPKPNLTFNQLAASVGVVDGDNSFGHHIGTYAMNRAKSLAADTGIGAVAIKNSSHCGALSYFGNNAAEAGMIGMVFTHATSRVRSANGTRPFFGNNPLCFMAPMHDEDAFCFDSATTTTTFNNIKHAVEKGESLPPGFAADRLGQETLDPRLAEQLIPIGDYKGFGLSMVVDVLCGILTGMATGDEVSQMFDGDFSKKRLLGHFFMAIDIEKFLSLDSFKQDLSALAHRVRNEPRANPSSSVEVPGDAEKATEEKRRKHGIIVDETIYSMFE